MTHTFKHLLTGFFLLTLCFLSSDFNRLSANNGYADEHAAWGGNAGWWGGGNNDFYSDRSWRNDDDYTYQCQRCKRIHTACSSCGRSQHHIQGRYCTPCSTNAYVPPNNEY